MDSHRIRALAATCGILLISTVAWADVLVGPVLSPVNGSTYFMLDADTWTASEAEAVGMGGHLATVRNQAENDWIVDTFDAFATGTAEGMWIGLNNLADVNSWVWVSGEESLWTNWNPGEPNFIDEHYGQMFASANRHDHPAGMWNNTHDDSWGYPCFGIVELTVPPTPGDADLDGDVDLDDFLWLKIYFGDSGDGVKWTHGDFDGDADVDLDDFVLLKSNFGGAAIPEPATMCLLILAGSMLRCRR